MMTGEMKALVRLRCKIVTESIQMVFIEQYNQSNRYPLNYFESLRNCILQSSADNLLPLAESYLQASQFELMELKSAHVQFSS